LRELTGYNDIEIKGSEIWILPFYTFKGGGIIHVYSCKENPKTLVDAAKAITIVHRALVSGVPFADLTLLWDMYQHAGQFMDSRGQSYNFEYEPVKKWLIFPAAKVYKVSLAGQRLLREVFGEL